MVWQVSGSFLVFLVLWDLPFMFGNVLLKDGVPHEGITDCNEYSYFEVRVLDPCSDLRIHVETIEGQPDLYVSKPPITRPTLDDLTWTSYEWGNEDLLISHWDPEFEIGSFFIGVHSYCGTDVNDNRPARYNITASIVPDPENLVLKSGSGVYNQSLLPNEYTHHRFCVPSPPPNVCQDILVHLENNLSLSAPEMLISRRNINPTLNSHSWKLAQIERRHVLLRHSDPNVRFGHYFVSVYGWCTPAGECGVPDEECPSSCSKVALDKYNIKIEVFETTCGQYVPPPTKMITPLQKGISVSGTTQCEEYTYYSIIVNEPCHNLRIHLDVLKGEGNLYVSKDPVLNPTLNDLTWTSYNWNDENLTIFHQDPEFETGIYYIGVHSYCGDDINDPIPAEYELTAHIEPVEENLLHLNVIDRGLVPNDYTHHIFCIPESNMDIKIDLKNNLSISYPELLVSRLISKPTIYSHSWKLAQIERRHIEIKHTDPNFKSGIYFISVYGWCTPIGECGVPDEECASSCSKVPHDRYSLSVEGVSILSTDEKNKNGESSPDVGLAVGLTLFIVAIIIASVLLGIWYLKRRQQQRVGKYSFQMDDHQ